MTAEEHVGATEDWSPLAEYGDHGEPWPEPDPEPKPRARPAWVDDSDLAGLNAVRDELDDIETRTLLTLDVLLDDALARLGFPAGHRDT